MDVKEYRKKRLIAVLVDLALLLILDAALLYVLLMIVKIYWVFGIVVCFVVHVLYSLSFTISPMQGTPGLYMNKLCVCSQKDSDASFGRLLIRAMASFFSGILLGFGFWYSFFDDRGNTIYDYLAGTKVKMIGKKNSIEKMALICCVGKTMNGRKFPIDQNGTLIGRNGSSCGIVFPSDEPCVSRIHCQVRYNQQTQTLLLRDVGSSYGTFLQNGERLKKDQIAIIMPGEKFYLGNKTNELMMVLPKS